MIYKGWYSPSHLFICGIKFDRDSQYKPLNYLYKHAIDYFPINSIIGFSNPQKIEKLFPRNIEIYRFSDDITDKFFNVYTMAYPEGFWLLESNFSEFKDILNDGGL